MPDNTLQEIKDRLNIAEVIGGYIPIKKAGGNYKAVCPFHSEKTPSLMISPSKQIWHCFGCGEGGDVFGFVMRYENLQFREVLKILADKAGVKLPAYSQQSKISEDQKAPLLRINDFASRFYHQILTSEKQGVKALEYLKQRGLNSETIKKWRIGFAPDDFHVLEKALAKKQVNVNDLVKAGVSARNEKGQVYDRFRGRITFPIFNYYNEVVGFSARILNGDRQAAKYVNSPETLIYNKSKILFGLNFAKESIRKKDEVIIVEGQMDCISAHQAGFANVVASSGTALTFDQLSLLGRLTKHLKFCLDADEAGFAATKRAIEIYLGQDLSIKIVDLAGAKDPDELIKRDFRQFEQQVKTAPLFLDYYIEKLFKNFAGDSVEQKKQIAGEILSLVKYLQDPVEQDHYVNLLAEKFNASAKVLWEALAKIKLKFSVSFSPQSLSKQPKAVKSAEPQLILEKEILGGVLLYPNFANFAFSLLEAEDFESYEVKKILEPAFQDGNINQIGQDSSLAKEAVFMVESRLDELGKDEQVLMKILKVDLRDLKLQSVKRRQHNLLTEIKRAENQKDKQQLSQLNKEFAAISDLRIKLEKGF